MVGGSHPTDCPDGSSVDEQLDPEVSRVLRENGLRARAFRCITTIRHPATGRTVYRIDLEDGRTIKARRVRSEEAARSLFSLRRHLPPEFAAFRAQSGAVLLEDWIEGELLGDKPPHDEHVLQAARLLAQLHNLEIAGDLRVRSRDGTAQLLTELENDFRTVGEHGALAADMLGRLRAEVRRLDPGEVVQGLVHRDFCGENMIVDAAGRLHLVDNERIGIGALGFDLARTWYRWALPAPVWDRFLQVYRQAVTIDAETDLPFWKIVVLVRSSRLRLHRDPGRSHAPLERLRKVAAEISPSS